MTPAPWTRMTAGPVPLFQYWMRAWWVERVGIGSVPGSGEHEMPRFGKGAAKLPSKVRARAQAEAPEIDRPVLRHHPVHVTARRDHSRARAERSRDARRRSTGRR